MRSPARSIKNDLSQISWTAGGNAHLECGTTTHGASTEFWNTAKKRLAIEHRCRRATTQENAHGWEH